MFDFLAEQDASICGGSHLKRREFLQVGVLGAAGLSLPQLLAAKEAGAVRPGPAVEQAAVSPQRQRTRQTVAPWGRRSRKLMASFLHRSEPTPSAVRGRIRPFWEAGKIRGRARPMR